VKRSEHLWTQAVACSQQALDSGALVPLATQLLADSGFDPFLVRRLVSRTPKHLGRSGPRPNPFLPWDPRLQVEQLGCSHLLLLNKYPVQPAHVLLITQQWQPQSGWLAMADWEAVSHIQGDTDGLWFFNSHAASGASQPHRHLQLLPRSADQQSCPLAPLLIDQLEGRAPSWPWSYRLSRRQHGHAHASGTDRAAELQQLYHLHARELEVGDPAVERQPRHAYNLLFDDHWFLSVRRETEHCAGFSLNGLGFAGYLLATPSSDLQWLQQHGPWQLLRQVASAP
jgi:ATP adenylyltransferase